MNLTLGMAAKHLGVTKSTLSKAIHSGKLSAERGRIGSFAINTAELDRYKAANEHRFQETRKEAASVSHLETPSDPVTETAIRGRLELEAKQKQAESSQRQLVDRPRRPFQRVQGEVGAAGEGLALMVLQLPCRVAPSLPPACDTQTLKTKGDYSYDNNARPGGSGPDRRRRRAPRAMISSATRWFKCSSVSPRKWSPRGTRTRLPHQQGRLRTESGDWSYEASALSGGSE